jgi:hypothetical protein
MKRESVASSEPVFAAVTFAVAREPGYKSVVFENMALQVPLWFAGLAAPPNERHVVAPTLSLSVSVPTESEFFEFVDSVFSAPNAKWMEKRLRLPIVIMLRRIFLSRRVP